MTTYSDDFDHERRTRESFGLARKMTARGGEPFGSVLVHDDEVTMRDSNRIVTESDVQCYLELQFTHRVCREYDTDERAVMVMYTSTEPCLMCAGEVVIVGFVRVVYGAGGDEIGEFIDSNPSIRSAVVFDAVIEVVGLVLNDEARRAHREYEWQEPANHHDKRRLNRSVNARSIGRFEQSETRQFV